MENKIWGKCIEDKGYILEDSKSSIVQSIYPIKRVLWSGSSEYCDNLLICESDNYNKMLFTDGELQSCEFDERIYHEYLVHPIVNIYCSLYSKRDLRVLVLGGGEGSTIRELLKYPIEIIKEIVWIDIDKDLLRLCRDYLKYCDDCIYDNSRVILRIEDANKFLDENKNIGVKFDILICDLPDPYINSEKGLYSFKFWNDIKLNMNKNGLIVSHLGPLNGDQSNFKLCDNLINQLQLKKENYKLGKVFIPSFISEWLYLFFSVDDNIKDVCLDLNILPNNLEIIDDSSLLNFFYFPNYYKKFIFGL